MNWLANLDERHPIFTTVVASITGWFGFFMDRIEVFTAVLNFIAAAISAAVPVAIVSVKLWRWIRGVLWRRKMRRAGRKMPLRTHRTPRH